MDGRECVFGIYWRPLIKCLGCVNVQQTPASKVKLVGFTNCHYSWVAEEDLQANHLSIYHFEQFQVNKSSATMDGVWSTKDGMLSVEVFIIEDGVLLVLTRR